MTRDRSDRRDLVASVRQRLLNLARARGEDFQATLTRYGLERLLYRLSVSRHRNDFVLKGAMLFAAWTDDPHRPTWDVDFLGRGDDDPARLRDVFAEVGQIAVEDDAVRFDTSVRGESIREDQRYGGVRLHMLATLGNARIPLQVDIGFGDAVTPGPIEIEGLERPFVVLTELAVGRISKYETRMHIALTRATVQLVVLSAPEHLAQDPRLAALVTGPAA